MNTKRNKIKKGDTMIYEEKRFMAVSEIVMNIKRYKEIIRKKDILTRALSEARKLNKSIIWE